MSQNVWDLYFNIYCLMVIHLKCNKRDFIFVFSNGQSLGKAFEQFNRDDKTYFPALTLSNAESISVNLGERPFKFPVIGSVPIVANPIALTDYFKRLEKNIISLIDNHIKLQSKVSLVLIYLNLFIKYYSFLVNNFLIKYPSLKQLGIVIIHLFLKYKYSISFR